MTNGQLAFALELFALNVVISGEALEQALGQGFNRAYPLVSQGVNHDVDV